MTLRIFFVNCISGCFGFFLRPLKTLFEFDHEELDRLFTAVWEESPEAGWSILLKAKEGVDLDLQQVVLKGHAAQLEGIEIWFSSKKWIAIHPQSETLCDGFAEDARRKYFREGGKLDE